jgi:hypothetical protein
MADHDTDEQEAYLVQSETLAPVLCRTIQVAVYGYPDGIWGVEWRDVVGIISQRRIGYWHPPRKGERYGAVVGITDREMQELGWHRDRGGAHTEILPVLAGRDPFEGELFTDLECSNRRYTVIVRCDWLPEKDRENALRIAKELVQNEGRINQHAEFMLEEKKPLATDGSLSAAEAMT